MKNDSTIKPFNRGQALMVFFLIICLLTGSVLISIYLNKSSSSASTADLTGQEPSKSSTSKHFPSNRYYFEVLMY